MSFCERCSSMLSDGYRRLKLKYAVPFLILLLYTIFGAAVLYFMENPPDLQARRDFILLLNDSRRQVMERMYEIKMDPFIVDNKTVQNRTGEMVDWFNKRLGIDKYLRDRTDMENLPWTWWGSMFYAGTIYSTIGYGRPYPATAGGQIFTCIYAIFGIPLFLVILKEVGKHLSRILRRYWKRSLKFVQRHRRVQQEKSPKSVEEADDRKRTSLPFPLSLPLVLVFLWIFLCAGVFCIWETNWTFLNSVYFVFISLSTIGLGDIVPSKPDLMLANFILIVIGLALISMTFNIIQIRLEEMMEDMLQRFIDDFEKMAASSGKHGLEIGLSSPLAAMPLQAMGNQPRRGGLDPSKWLATQLMKSQTRKKKRRLSDTESSSEEEEEKEANENLPDVFKKFAHDHPAGSLLLSRAMEDEKVQKIRQQIESAEVAVQTENDFTEILYFLEIPKKEMDTQTEISYSPSLTQSSRNSISSIVQLDVTDENYRPPGVWVTTSRRSAGNFAESESLDSSDLNQPPIIAPWAVWGRERIDDSGQSSIGGNASLTGTLSPRKISQSDDDDEDRTPVPTSSIPEDPENRLRSPSVTSSIMRVSDEDDEQDVSRHTVIHFEPPAHQSGTLPDFPGNDMDYDSMSNHSGYSEQFDPMDEGANDSESEPMLPYPEDTVPSQSAQDHLTPNHSNHVEEEGKKDSISAFRALLKEAKPKTQAVQQKLTLANNGSSVQNDIKAEKL